jgi:hypothetical protein
VNREAAVLAVWLLLVLAGIAAVPLGAELLEAWRP